MAVLIRVKSGVCQGEIHKVGRTFRIDETTPAGLCMDALDAIYPYLMTLQYGADLPRENEKGLQPSIVPIPTA